MTWFASPFKSKTDGLVHVVLGTRERPKREGYLLCAQPVADAQRLSARNRSVPTTCERCTVSLTGFFELREAQGH